MAHAAPAPARSTSAGRPATPSVTTLGKVLPVVAGAVYGFWAANIQRFGQEVTGGNIALGFVSGIVVAALCFGIHQWCTRQGSRHIGVRALVWGAFAGIAVGFLQSLANSTVLWNIVLGAIVAGSTFVAVYYRYYSSSEYAPEHDVRT
ncbi:hypothetical protein G3I40_06995 [Streptomyces sp. SID14478]|uniref:hypothetical protein n=1 Tax=Streptomyces sp. SID14478 TaxID=2706073 RepID=UPI0013DD5883|nr:hypothetical protein [Streptomyces sp. SID14478]NEB74981.1 hypothetical protein [Streptomyces sp. SID14478]